MELTFEDWCNWIEYYRITGNHYYLMLLEELIKKEL